MKLYKFDHWSEGTYETVARNLDEAYDNAERHYDRYCVDMVFIGEEEIKKS